MGWKLDPSVPWTCFHFPVHSLVSLWPRRDAVWFGIDLEAAGTRCSMGCAGSKWELGMRLEMHRGVFPQGRAREGQKGGGPMTWLTSWKAWGWEELPWPSHS